MTGRPDPVAIRAAARRIVRAAEEMERDATVASGSISRLAPCWTGSAALVHAGEAGHYARELRGTADALRRVGEEATAVALHLDRELIELARLESRSAFPGLGETSAAPLGPDVRIEEVWSSIRCHQARFARALDAIDPRHSPPSAGRRMRTGPVRVPDLGEVDPPRMRTGPVRPIGGGPPVDTWGPGHARTGPVRRLLTVHRPVLSP